LCFCEAQCTPVTETLFSNGFESGNLTGWTVNGDKWGVNSYGEHSGSYAAIATGDTGTNDDTIKKAVSTADYQNIVLGYWYQIAQDIENEDHLYVEWFDGSNWNVVRNYTNINAGNWIQETISLSTGANQNASFEIRFRADLGNQTHDIVRLDDVLVTGNTVCP